MSIWSSTWALDRQLPMEAQEHAPEGIWPRAYQRSHVYPSTEHPPASIDLASLPHWCIPGHDAEAPWHTCSADGCDATADGDASGVAPWLRLAIDDPSGYLTVVLPTAAVEALRDELTDWLGRVHREGSET